MACFPKILDPEDPGMRNLYREIVSCGFGRTAPLGWFTTQATRPDLLRATWQMVRAIQVEGLLPRTLKQMILLAISARNRCRYCAAIHTRALEAAGVPRAVLDSCANDPELAAIPAPHRSIVRYATAVAISPSSVGQADIEALRELGLSAGEIMELTMLAALANFANTWAEAIGLEAED